MDVRWWILICCSIIGFTTDFFTEEPGILVQRLTGTADACKDGTDRCASLSVKQFNLLYSANMWASAIGAFCSGLIVDRYGCKYALWGSAALLIIGGSLFVGGTYFKDAPAVFTTMIIGNIVAGVALGATAVICHRIKASWFLYKELAVAYSIHLFCGRLGSAISYLVIGALVPSIGLHPCLWIGYSLLVLASIALIIMSFLDERGAAMVYTSPPKISAGVVWSFLKSLDSVFWCFAVMVPFYYGTVSTFTANGPNFLAAYGYSESEASYTVGVIYDVALFSLLFGWLTDRYGRRENWFLAASGLLFLAFLLLTIIANFPAWLLTILIGFGYTIFGPTLWSSVALVVIPAYVGSALGLLKFCHYAGVGVLTAVAGEILQVTADDKNAEIGPWTGFVIQLLVTSFIILMATGVMVYCNLRTGSRLTPSQQEREVKNGLQEYTPLSVGFGTEKAVEIRVEEAVDDAAEEADTVHYAGAAGAARPSIWSDREHRRMSMRKLSQDLTRVLISR